MSSTGVVHERASSTRLSRRLMKLSVVMPVFNAATTIGQQLEALSRQHSDHWWEVVVADNGSTDGSLDVVRAYADAVPRLRIVSAAARRGPGHARNSGVRAAAGDYILFCDADDMVAPGWLSAMATALSQHEFVACRYDWERLNPSWIVKGRGGSQVNGPERITFMPFMSAGGGGIGIRRATHEAVGGFDESLLTLEDIEYCMRIQSAGVPLTGVPDALVHCRHPATCRDIYIQARNWAQDEQLLFKRYVAPHMNELWRWRAFLQENLAYVAMLPKLLRTPEGRALCAWRVGRQVGCFKGSLRHGVPPVTGY